MERTDQLMKRAEADLKSIPGVAEVLTTGGLNLLTNAYTSNNASIIIMLKPWEERKSKEEQIKPIMAAARKKFSAYPEAVSLVFPPPQSMASETPPDLYSSCRTRRAGLPGSWTR